MELVNKLMSKMEKTYNGSKSRSTEKEEKENDPKEPLESVCLLFPTYATRFLDGKISENWNVRVRGWAFSAPKKSKTRSLFLGLTSLALQKDDERYQFLQTRTSYFWASNVSQGEFTVQVEGLTDPNKMSIEGDPNDDGTLTTAEESVESQVPRSITTSKNTKAPDVPDVIKVLDQAGKKINAQIQSDIENIRQIIKPNLGHFSGDLSIPEQTIIKWVSGNKDQVVSGLIVESKDVRSKDVRSKDNVVEINPNVIGSKNRLLRLKVFKDGTDPHYGVVNLIEPEGVSIISDIDDTIKDTDILEGAKRVLSNTFLQPFRDVPGMADLYRKFYEKGASIHYVSNSPWQLFPFLRSFFHTYNFPPGSAHFKFYDGLIKSAYEQKENPMASKFMYINELLKDFPNRKFILIGDTGELDPEIYTTVARDNPGRILRIYVRDVTTDHVKDLPPEKPKHSYTRTFPAIYNRLRNYYSSGDENIEGKETNKEGDDSASSTSSGVTKTDKSERKPSLGSRLKDRLHIDVSYLHGTAIEPSKPIEDSPNPIEEDSPNPIENSPKTTSKPKTPLSAKILSPERASALYSKFSSKFHKSEDKSGKTEDKSGKTEDKSGKTEDKSGKTEDNSGKTEDKSGKIDGVDSDVGSDDEDDTYEESENEVLKTPLEMFHERLEKLKEGLPEGLFHTFTDAKEIENDPAIRAELKY